MTQRHSLATEFIVLTGFLGTGKTTLLSDFLAQPEATDTAVIINEAGQINIDGAIIAETGRALPVALLSNGCVCCSVTNDLLYTIEALIEGRAASGQLPFRRIVLECSGLAQPSSVLRSLGPLAALAMPTRIIATIDAKGLSLDVGFEDAVAQLAAAQTIVLTKLDSQARQDTREVRSRVQSINPLARIVASANPRERALEAFVALDKAAKPGEGSVRLLSADDPFAHPRISTVLATFPFPPTWPDLEEWLENLVGFCGARLLRLKGIVSLVESSDPILIQAVGTQFSVPRRLTRSPGCPKGLVVITRDLPIALLESADLGCRAAFAGDLEDLRIRHAQRE